MHLILRSPERGVSFHGALSGRAFSSIPFNLQTVIGYTLPKPGAVPAGRNEAGAPREVGARALSFVIA